MVTILGLVMNHNTKTDVNLWIRWDIYK
jgi:hypothetical protein